MISPNIHSFVLMELVANKHRPLITAFLFLTTVPFAAFGAVIARALAGYTALGWRWNYYLNLITQAIAVTLFFFCYHPPSYQMLHEGKSIRKQLAELDYGGITLFVGGLVSLVLGLSWGGGLFPWTSPSVIAPLVIGFVTLIAFGFYGQSSSTSVYKSRLTSSQRSTCRSSTLLFPQVYSKTQNG